MRHLVVGSSFIKPKMPPIPNGKPETVPREYALAATRNPIEDSASKDVNHQKFVTGLDPGPFRFSPKQNMAVWRETVFAFLARPNFVGVKDDAESRDQVLDLFF